MPVEEKDAKAYFILRIRVLLAYNLKHLFCIKLFEFHLEIFSRVLPLLLFP